MDKKLHKLFVCSKCDAQHLKWQGRCTECGSWGTVNEETSITKPDSDIPSAPPAKTESLAAITSLSTKRISTGIAEFDLVFVGRGAKGMVLVGAMAFSD